MAISKKDLQALRKDFKALEKKMEKLVQTVEKSGKANKVTKAKAVKPKAVKKAKVAAGKKAPQNTATDQILKIIKRSKKGVDVPTLKKKTGFNDKKVRNIVFRASKEGRIKKSGRGVYVGA
jgi:5-formyltetrahydrofolate cyclo-ligase